MRHGGLVVAVALSTFIAVSCKDDGNSNPVEPPARTPQNPSLSRGTINPNLPVKFAPSAAAVAEAKKIEAANSDVSILSSPGTAPHDPTINRMRVNCLNAEDGTANPLNHGDAWPFSKPFGCELNTNDGDTDPNNNLTFVYPTLDLMAGRHIAATQQLLFYFAGGEPLDETPRFSLFVDRCEPNTTTGAGCPAGTATDGSSDETVFVSAHGCNDGDAYVGALVVYSASGKTDPTCAIDDKNHGVFTSWADYLAFPAHQGARWATDERNYITTDRPNHYLIYRVNMKAGTN